MGKPSGAVLFVWLALLALVPRIAQGQEPPLAGREAPAVAEPGAPANASAAPTLQEAPVQILMQEDESGTLEPTPLFAPTEGGVLRQHVLSWTDIDRLLDRSADAQSPRVTCRQVAIQGTVNGARANLEITFTFLTSPNRWVRAPLGLPNVVVSQFSAPLGGFLDVDDKEGLVLWMPPAAEKPAAAASKSPPEADDELVMPMMPSLQMVERQLKVVGSAAVVENGSEKRLALRVPRAASARLELLVDTPEAQVSFPRSETLVQTQPAGTGQTRIAAEGLGAEVIVAWRPKQAPTPRAGALLEVQGVVEVNLDEIERLVCSARLTVRSLTEPFQTLTVRLPPGMRLAPLSATDYDVAPATTGTAAGEAAASLAVVRLRQPTVGPVTVRLDATSQAPTEPSAFVEAGGFEVVDAVRQWGHLLLTSSGNPSVSWVESPNIVQVDDAPPPPSRAENVVARFKYFAQPFSFQVKAAPQKTRMRVEPTYLLEVFSDHVKLTANLKCQIFGAKASYVRVDFQGWEVDSVAGANVANPDGVKYDRLSPLEIPFRTPVSGEVAIKVTARRILEGERGSLRVPLPTPVADFVVSALLAVAPNDNIEMTFQGAQSHGLLAEAPAPVEGLPPNRKATMFYRTRTGEPQAVFAADYEVKTGSLTVAADGEVRLRNQLVTVRQRFAYTLAYEPVNRLAVDLPRAVYEAGDFQFLFDDAPIAPKPEPPQSAEWQRLRFEPPLSVGRHVLTVEYSLPLPAIAAAQTAPYALPLALPAAAEGARGAPKMTSNVLRISASPPLRVALEEREWRVRSVPGPVDADREAIVGSADAAYPRLPLLVTRERTSEQPRWATIDRFWLQTWLTTAARRDRAAFRLATSENRLQVRLPEGVDPASVLAFVEGRQLGPEQLSIEAPAGAGSSVVTATLDLTPFAASHYAVELWYGFSAPRERTWKLRLEAPRIANAGWVSHVYWQLVLPGDVHVAKAPAGLTPEQVWRFRNGFWERRPTLAQRELERWSGASWQPSPASSNVYLYSRFGEVESLEAYTIPRHIAVLGWSGLLLVLGLRTLHRPAGRPRRGIAEWGFAFAVALLAAVLLAPETTLLVAQSAALGAVCLMVGWAVSRVLAPRTARMPFEAGTVSRRRPGAASHDGSLGSRSASQGTTATVPGSPVHSSP